ncbi:methyltransferase domain-containing protein [Nonomuraea sp. KC401]|uniref:FAD-dependent oxidoreductase n=1 Tax=unclassified Nonomuraea TaxID=2593643 RepID=UPI0010FD21EA|nr:MULTISPECIES: FAD-dependent oxidoreductase [unclassified Nonomuraea]NBE92153.1 methyltransferase domain-containing protein [Nonomuraea sp. K271]TLF85650.1 methyltransferase domain-containing protein [Nonomuraea sp. KC401]
METRYDVVVIGGGAAGLSGALTLTRARRRVLVIDEGRPRNAPADGVHVYLGREGVPPHELLAAGREEVAGYGGEIVTGTVETAERVGKGFRLGLADGSQVEAARLLVTTGLVDELPDIPGLAGLWGRDVLHCPYCHGWEVRDQAIGVIAAGPLAVHQALLWRQWSEDVTLFRHTAPEFGGEDVEQLVARDITVVEGRITGLELTEGRLSGVRVGGTVVPRRALTVSTRLIARSGVLAGLGVETAEQETLGHVIGTHVPADPTGATNVPGVWVAGNVTNLVEQVIGSAAAGVRAGAAINADLIAGETRQAVAVHRAHAAGQIPPEEFWDGFYRERPQIWSGKPNVMLVREAADLEPGRALDLGCGEGADAIWLAERGWRVTASDISRVALDRAAEHAKAAEVADRIDWQRHDLGRTFPDGRYDLVSASFLHSKGELPREKILRSAAAAVAPGGVLLVLGHGGWPSWEHDPMPEVHFPTTQEVLDALELPEGEWEVLRSEEYERSHHDHEGRPGTRTDNVLKVRRRP